MYLRFSPTRSWSFFGYSYRLTAHLVTTPEELHLIRAHHLDAIEIFIDDYRQHLETAAEAAHDDARSHGLFVTSLGDALHVAVSETRAVALATRARFAFTVSVGDLIARVTIGNSSLAANQHVRSVLLKSLDQIKADVEAARAYDDESEDFYAPDDDEPAPPPSTWLKPRS